MTTQKFDSLYDLQFHEEQFKQKVKNFEIKKCQNPLHSDYTLDEICIDRSCPNIYEPICSACKFKNHQNHETQHIKVFLLDLIVDTFRGNKIEIFQDNKADDSLQKDKLFQDLQKVLQNCEILVKKSQQLLENFRNIYNQYRDMNQLVDPQKFNVRKILLQILYSKDQQQLTENLQNLKGEVFTQKKEAFVYTKFDSDIKKSNIVYNSKTIIDAMEDNMQKMNLYYNNLLDISNPLKIGRQWMDRFKNDGDLKNSLQKSNAYVSAYEQYKINNASDIFDKEFQPIKPNSYQRDLYKEQQINRNSNLYKNKSTLFGTDHSRYLHYEDKYGLQKHDDDDVYKVQNDIFSLNKSSIDKPGQYQDMSQKQKYLWGIITDLKERMDKHLRNCKNRLCKQIVQDIGNGTWQIMPHDKNPFSIQKCDIAQKLNNEMKLLKNQFDECYKY